MDFSVMRFFAQRKEIADRKQLHKSLSFTTIYKLGKFFVRSPVSPSKDSIKPNEQYSKYFMVRVEYLLLLERAAWLGQNFLISLIVH